MAEVVGLPQLQRRLTAITSPKAGEAMMRRLALATVREARILVPRKTGNLSRSIHVASVSATEATVVAATNYAAFVEFGTQPHEITPKARKALRFAASAAGRRLSGSPRVGADVVFATKVHHPGTRPHPFLLPAAQKAVGTAGLDEQIVTEWNGAA